MLLFVFCFCLFVFSRATPVAHGGSQARGPVGAVAASLHHSHSNTGSEPHLWPTPQLTATPDPQPTERGQGSDPRPHGCSSGSFVLRHDGNSINSFFCCCCFCLFVCFQGCTLSLWRARDPIRAVAASLHHSHSNTRTKPCL